MDDGNDSKDDTAHEAQETTSPMPAAVSNVPAAAK